MNTMKNLKLWSLLLLAGSMLTFTGCNDDDEGPAAVEIISITATGTDLTTGAEVTIDLNGVSTATDVPPNATLAVTFSREIDATTATTSSVTLNDGTSDVALTVSVSGSTVTVSHADELLRGTIHTISVTSALKAKDGGAFVTASRTFTTAGRAPAVIPQEAKLVVYLPFEGAVTEEMGHTVLNDNVGFAADRFGNFEASGDFNGTTNYVGVEYGADMSNANTTVSYWIKLPASQDYKDHIGTTDTGITQYVTFGIGGNNGTYHEWNRFTCCDLGFDIDVLKYFTNHLNSGGASELAGSSIEMKNEGNPGGDKVVEIDNPTWTEGITGEWTHIVTSWDAASHRKAFYINGVPSTVYELTPNADYTLDDAIIDVTGIDADASNNKNLYVGSGVPYWASIEGDGIVPFRGGKAFAFKGQMDDFRMYSVALTDQEVADLYNAEKP
jgi:hypothetical protein